MMEQTNHSTDTLLASFQAGNMAAFSQLYNLHINVLFNYGLKLTIDKELHIPSSSSPESDGWRIVRLAP